MEEVSKNTGKTPSPSVRSRIDRKGSIMRYYYQGYSLADISAKIKAEFGQTMTVGSISSLVHEHVQTLKASRSDVVAEYKHVELEKINRLEVAYWSAWEKSTSVQITTREVFKAPPKPAKVAGQKTRAPRKKADSLGELESTIRETKTLVGDAKYLQGVQWCIEQRMKFLGVEAATKNEFGNNEAGKELLEGMEERNLPVQEGPRRIVFKVAGL